MLNALAIACFVFSVLPINTLPHGLVRVFDFPRLQLLVLSIICAIAIVFTGSLHGWSLAALAAATVAAFIQAGFVVRFLPVWPAASAAVSREEQNAPIISLVSANVKQGNRDYSRLEKLLSDTDPDLVILMETDDDWVEGIARTISRYPHKLLHPLPNTYGMVLLSKLALEEAEVRFLLNEEVPSIDTKLVLENGRRIRLFSLHPEPPLPHMDTIGRDAEIMVAAKEVGDAHIPTIVAGDLNDVAWSSTTRRFLRVSGLIDPREGRGFFNTFDARIPVIRWPLDHVFHSGQFRYVEMRRLPHIGSDHFPIYCRLALTENGEHPAESANPNGADEKETEFLEKMESNRDRKPIGSDWENKN